MKKKIKDLTNQEFLEAHSCYNKSGVVNCKECKLIRFVKRSDQVVLDPVCPCNCNDYKEIYGEDEIEINNKIIKKRIKDLTLEELHTICMSYEACKDCPLCVGGDEYRGIFLCDPEPLKDEDDWNQEIEVNYE